MKITVKTVKYLWIDEELNHFMVERDEEKGMANKSGCKLRSCVTKLNKMKLYYETKINDIKDGSKKLWTNLNNILAQNVLDG